MSPYVFTHYRVIFKDAKTGDLVTIEQPFTIHQLQNINHGYRPLERNHVAISRATAQLLVDKWNTLSLRQGGAHSYLLPDAQ